MSDAIQLQADISSLSLHGLGAFSTILATLSADDIAPMAMVQLERLGALFHTSGKFAAKVPDMLTRVKSHPLGRLATTVGWRKGDSASLLAKSAAGQAIALLSTVLLNLFHFSDSGDILFQLSRQRLPVDSAISSPFQLARASELMDQKLFALSFGNFLAEQTVRVYDTYRSLNINMPTDLLDSLTVDAAVAFLQAVSEALQEEDKLVRISGTSGIGNILALVLFLFPRDTAVTIDDIFIHEGDHQSIFIELRALSQGPVEVTIEYMTNTRTLCSPISITTEQHDIRLTSYRFSWHGWLTRSLDLAFASAGSICTQEIREALCDLLVAICHAEASENGLCLTSFLGRHPQLKIDQTLRDTLLASPSSYDAELPSAFTHMAKAVEREIKHDQICSCQTYRPEEVWLRLDDEHLQSCKAGRVWLELRKILELGILCLFISAGTNVSIAWPASYGESSNRHAFMKLLPSSLEYVRIERIPENVFSLLDMFVCPSPIGRLIVSAGSTIYSTLLPTLELPLETELSFELLDGNLEFNHRRHSELLDKTRSVRPKAKKSITHDQFPLQPSNMGASSGLSITVREKIGLLAFRLTARYDNANVDISLYHCILSSCYLKRTVACVHPVNSAFMPTVDDNIVLTSVASPHAEEEQSISVVMANRDRTAQLLCCDDRDAKEDEPRGKTLLTQNCCLSCAVTQAKQGGFKTIIVS
ncbi:MAG: hypothetical protein Q9157_008781 [Trypethelium eluteriae]